MNGKISPSIMCADFKNLERDIRALERAGVEYLHLDIMDGHFVPNFTMGPDILKSIREITDIPFDIHLMVEKPENYIDIFKLKSGDMVSVHAESTVHLQRVLQKIKDAGAKAAVALNPATPLVMIKHVLNDMDMLVVMTVNPGFAGQKLVPATLDKIKEAYVMRQEMGLSFEIEVDGNVSFENARIMRLAGADIFVAGTSSIYNRSIPMEEAAARLREAIL